MIDTHPSPDATAHPTHPFASIPTATRGFGDARRAQSNLDEDIARAEQAYQLMLVADACLKAGADGLMLMLGFSQAHVDELRERAGPGGGYPAYSMKNIRKTIRVLRQARGG